MESTDQWLTDRLATTVKKLGKRNAREMAREMREAAVERARLRKENLKMRVELGTLVVEAGLSDWSRDEVSGLLLDGRDRATQSQTARLAMRKRGETFSSSRTPGTSAPVSVAPTPETRVH